MALAKGTNCGFVTVAPSADPAGSNGTGDTGSFGFKDTTPAGYYWVTEIGWYCDNATEAANFDVGIYTHDVTNNRPAELVGVASTAAKGTSSGWKKISGLHIPVNGNTIYWVAMQLDNTATATNVNYTATGGEKYDGKNAQTELPTTWGASDTTLAALFAVYAVIVRRSVGFPGVSDLKIF